MRYFFFTFVSILEKEFISFPELYSQKTGSLKEYLLSFFNETCFNQNKFLLLLVSKVTSAFDVLTRPDKVRALLLDDSVIARNRSNSVELLARIYNHVT